jgi:hypothetical protein
MIGKNTYSNYKIGGVISRSSRQMSLKTLDTVVECRGLRTLRKERHLHGCDGGFPCLGGSLVPD